MYIANPDYYQSRDAAAEPPAIGGCLPLEQVYDFDPVPRAIGIGSARARHVLGVQGNIWTEYIPTPPAQAFPRSWRWRK